MKKKKKSFSKKYFLTGIALVALLGAAVVAFKGQGAEEYDSALRVDKLVIRTASGKERVFKVEVAEKPIDIQIGLMYRKLMPRDHGMLFVIGGEPREVSFWMKNTLIPLDMLFVGKDGTIANIHRNAQPLSLDPIRSRAPITAVIELNGGATKDAGIETGDRVIHPYFK